MIDFTLTPSQHQLRTAASSFRTTVLSTARDSYDTLPTQTERFRALRPTYRKAVEAGLVAGQVPKALGGTGGALIDAALLVEEIYHGDPSAALAVLGTGLGLLPLIFGGNEEQHTTFLEPFLNGNGEPLASLVHSEPQGTANWLEKGAHGLRTTARQEGDEWIINGEKVSAFPAERLRCSDLNTRLTNNPSSGQQTAAAGTTKAQTSNASSAAPHQPATRRTLPPTPETRF